MKKILLSLCFLSIEIAVAQTTIYNGNGTLSSNRTVTMNGRSLNFLSSTVNENLFINGTTGRVGLGTVSPSYKLDVRGDLSATIGNFTNSVSGTQSFATNTDRVKASLVLSGGTLLDASSGVRTFCFMDMPASNFNPEPWSWFNIDDRNFNTRLRMIGKTNSGTEFELMDKTQQLFFRVIDNGNNWTMLSLPKEDSYLGIGTESFTDGTDVYRLSVKGAVRADRVKVYTTWADFVFEENYKLPTIDEVEKHIKENGHLKDIPSAKEVEENGIELGEMNKRLLQKIEELTLYIIQMNKDLESLKNKVENR